MVLAILVQLSCLSIYHL